jgi:signal transduction histidine kinase
LQGERAAADAERLDERAERRRVLEALLHLGRAETDLRLMMERTRADEGLSTGDQFMGMVSHDLRTLLGGIALQAALLKRVAAEDEVGRKTVQAAEKIQPSL